jgi:predicted Zn-dependent peptidase
MHPLPHTHIETTQFKTNLIVLRFFSPIEESTTAAHALLPDILLSGTTRYPTRRLLQQALEGLYDTRIRTSVMRLGTQRVTQFSVEYLDDSVSPESVTEHAIALLADVLYHPHLVNGQFDLSVIERERRLMIEELEANEENKGYVANKAFKEVLFQGEQYAIDVDGTLELIPSVDAQLLQRVYQELLHSPGLMVSVGASNPAAYLNLFQGKQKPVTLVDRETTTREEPQYVSHQSRFLQASVMIGYRTPICFDDELYYPMILADSILGGSQSSLLFEQVREAHSLAYSVYSSYQGAKGAMVLSAGVDPAQVTKSTELMLQQVTRLQQGDFSDTLLDNAKRLWMQEVETVFDTNTGTALKTIHDWALGRQLSKHDSIHMMQQVTKADVINAANTLQLDTVFAYSPKEVTWTSSSTKHSKKPS